MSVRYQIYKEKIKELQDKGISPEEFLSQYAQEHPEYADKIKKAINKGYDPNYLTSVILYHESQPSLTKEFTSSIAEAGSETMRLYDTLMSRLLGSDYFKQRASQWQQQAEEYSNPSVPDIWNVKNLNQAAHSTARMAGQLAEFLGEVLATGGLGEGAALLGKGAAKVLGKNLLKEEAAKVTGKEFLEQATKEATKKTLPKLTSSQTGTLVGLSLPEIEREYEVGGEKHPIAATVGGLATGALYTLSPFRLLRSSTEKATKAVVDDLLKVANPSKSVIKSPVLDSLKEGVEQAAILGAATATSELGSYQTPNPTDILHQAILGGLMGTAGHAIGSKLSGKYKVPREESQPIEEKPKTTQEQKPKEPTNALVPLKTNITEDIRSDIDKAPLHKNAEKLTTPINHLTKDKNKQEVLKQFVKRAVKEGAYDDLMKNDFVKYYRVLRSADFTPLEIYKKFGDKLPDDIRTKLEDKFGEKAKLKNIKNLTSKDKLEISKELNSLIEKSNKVTSKIDSELLISAKKNKSRVSLIRSAFDKGDYAPLLKTNFDKTYKVLKSAGITDKDIFEKYKDNIPKDKFTKDMIIQHILPEGKLDETNFTDVIKKTAEFSELAKNNINVENIEPALKKVSSKVKSFLEEKAKTIKVPEDKREIKAELEKINVRKDNPVETLSKLIAIKDKIKENPEKTEEIQKEVIQKTKEVVNTIKEQPPIKEEAPKIDTTKLKKVEPEIKEIVNSYKAKLPTEKVGRRLKKVYTQEEANNLIEQVRNEVKQKLEPIIQNPDELEKRVNTHIGEFIRAVKSRTIQEEKPVVAKVKEEITKVKEKKTKKQSNKKASAKKPKEKPVKEEKPKKQKQVKETKPKEQPAKAKTEQKYNEEILKKAKETISKDELITDEYTPKVTKKGLVGTIDNKKKLHITPPPEFSKDKVETFDKYLKQAGIDEKSIHPDDIDDFKRLYELRKEQAEKGITKENLVEVAKVFANIHFLIDDNVRLKLSADGKKLASEYKSEIEKVSNELSKVFDIDHNKVLEKILGKEFASKIKVKSISHLKLEDLGGRDAVLKAIKDGYGLDLSHLTDKELLNRIRSGVNGALVFNPKDASALVVLAHHTTDNIGKTFYHELFHIVESYGLLPEKEINILKKELEKRYKGDPREWYEKAADDFAYYVTNKRMIPATLRNIFAKIKRFLNRLGLKFKQHPEDIYAGILSGKYQPNADFLAYAFARKPERVKFDFEPSNNFEKELQENFFNRNNESLKLNARDKFISAIKYVADFFTEFGKGIAPELHKEETVLYEDAVRRAASIRQVAHHKTQEALLKITHGLTKDDVFLMTKVLILRDIKKNIDNGIQTFDNLNRQWNGAFKDIDHINELLNQAEKELSKNKKVQLALKKRKEVYKQILDYLVEKGYIGELRDLDPDTYFHRITAAYFNGKIRFHNPTMMEVPITDPLRERINSNKPYITDYIYSDYEALVQLHTLYEYDKILDQLKRASSDKLEEMILDYVNVKGEAPKDMKQLWDVIDNIPSLKEKYKDYTLHHITDIPHYYTIWTVGDDLATKILKDQLTDEDLSKLKFSLTKKVAIQKHDDIILLHKDVLKALRRITAKESDSTVLRLLRWNNALFKKFVLFSPFRFAKYMINNISSDIDVIFATTPKILFTHAPKATKDLYYYFYDRSKLDKKTLAEIDEAVENLVLGTNITSEEVVNISNFEQFRQLMGTEPTIFERWWEFSSKLNNFRESILRLALYRWYKERINAGELEELPSVIDYKMAKRYLQKGMKTELAARMARELIGDYGNISPSGQFLRKNIIPFWSWQEVNLPRYTKLLKNSFHQKTKYGKLYPLVFVAKASILYSTIVTLNSILFPEVDKVVNDPSNGQLSLILGVDKDGQVHLLRFQGALNDALDWFGLGNIKAVSKEISSGRTTLSKFIFKEMPLSLLNKAGNMAFPIEKTVLESLSGLSFYPDITKPTVIRDRIRHLAGLYGLALPYKILLSGDPAPKRDRDWLGALFDIIKSSVFNTRDLNSVNYHIVNDLVDTFLENEGLQRYGYIHNKRSDYAFYFKKALQYGDKKKAIHFLAMYYYYGGNLKSLNKSIKMMNPLVRIPKSKLHDFYEWLTPEDKERIKLYMKWYRDVFIRKSKFKRSELLEIYREAYKLSIRMKKGGKK